MNRSHTIKHSLSLPYITVVYMCFEEQNWWIFHAEAKHLCIYLKMCPVLVELSTHVKSDSEMEKYKLFFPWLWQNI